MNDRERALRRLVAVGRRRRALELEELALTGEARQAGATWQEIAARTGYRDRRGAYMRFLALKGRYS